MEGLLHGEVPREVEGGVVGLRLTVLAFPLHVALLKSVCQAAKEISLGGCFRKVVLAFYCVVRLQRLCTDRGFQQLHHRFECSGSAGLLGHFRGMGPST